MMKNALAITAVLMGIQVCSISPFWSVLLTFWLRRTEERISSRNAAPLLPPCKPSHQSKGAPVIPEAIGADDIRDGKVALAVSATGSISPREAVNYARSLNNVNGVVIEVVDVVGALRSGEDRRRP
jgi:hypothetical protein